MQLINGQKVAEKLLKKIERQVGLLKAKRVVPKLAVILVGDDPGSVSYIKKKEQSCQEIGIDFELFKFHKNVSEEKLVKDINTIQKDKKISGLIIQLPLPKKLNSRKILDKINPDIDVDCLTSYSLGKLTANDVNFIPPTASAILELLKQYEISFEDKHIVVVGRGELVGKPMSIILTQKQNTVTMCGRNTKNLKNFTKQADILITAVGIKDLVTADMVKKGVVVLDAGIMVEKTKVSGDVDFDGVKEKAKMITPVPGGVGPVTVAMLLSNVVAGAKNNKHAG